MKKNRRGVGFSPVRRWGISRLVSDRMKERDNNVRLPEGYGAVRYLPVLWGILLVILYITVRVLMTMAQK